MLDSLSKEALLIPVAGKSACYRWARNAAGRRMGAGVVPATDPKAASKAGPKAPNPAASPTAGPAAGPAASPAASMRPLAPRPIDEAAWKSDADLIGDFERLTGVLTGHAVDLTAWASQFGIIGTSPAWSDVRRAIERLRAGQGNPTPYAEQEDDAHVLKSFRGVIETGSDGVALALVCASALGSIYPTPPPMDWTLSNLESAFRLRILSPQEVVAKLSTVLLQVGEYNKAALGLRTPPPITDRASVSAWNAWVADAAMQVKTPIPDEALAGFDKTAWRYWESRLRFQLSMPEDPAFETILCHVLSRGPARFLSFDIDKMLTCQWTQALAASLWQTQIKDGSAPCWLAVAALQRMYFNDATLSRCLMALRQFDETLSPSEFRQLGSYGPTSRPAGIVYFRKGARSIYWTPSETHPLLICDENTAMLLLSALNALEPGFLKSLALSYMVFDHSSAFPDPAGEPHPPTSSDPAFLAILPDSTELQRYSQFRPNATGPIPVLVDNPGRWAGRDTRYSFVSANNPQELSHAVADKLSETG